MKAIEQYFHGYCLLCCSLQCRRFWWFSSVKPPFWIRWRLRELGRECENGGPNFSSSLPLAWETFYLAPTLHCFSNSRWRPEQPMGISTRPAKILLHCRLIMLWKMVLEVCIWNSIFVLQQSKWKLLSSTFVWQCFFFFIVFFLVSTYFSKFLKWLLWSEKIKITKMALMKELMLWQGHSFNKRSYKTCFWLIYSSDTSSSIFHLGSTTITDSSSSVSGSITTSTSSYLPSISHPLSNTYFPFPLGLSCWKPPT